MKKIAFLYYRSWAHDILKYINQIQSERKDFIISDVICAKGIVTDLTFLNDAISIHYVDPEEPSELIKIFEGSDVEIVFCYSWSWFIPEELIKNLQCICLHPSKLPKYRGGSPIQNQVFSGDLKSAVTVFKMNTKLDAGPIYKQMLLDLDAPIGEVFKRMSSIGRVITKDLIADYLNDSLNFHEQNHSEATVVKRRKPKDSSISLEEIENLEYCEFQRRVNILKDPYPNMYIEFEEFRLKINEIHSFRYLPEAAQPIKYNTPINTIKKNQIFIKTLDRFALVSGYIIEGSDI